jgi:hypothetical protein
MAEFLSMILSYKLKSIDIALLVLINGVEKVRLFGLNANELSIVVLL